MSPRKYEPCPYLGGKTESTVIWYNSWCFLYFNCLKNNTRYKYPQCRLKKMNVQFEYLANFTHQMPDFRHWIFECPNSNILLASHSFAFHRNYGMISIIRILAQIIYHVGHIGVKERARVSNGTITQQFAKLRISLMLLNKWSGQKLHWMEHDDVSSSLIACFVLLSELIACYPVWHLSLHPRHAQ